MFGYVVIALAVVLAGAGLGVVFFASIAIHLDDRDRQRLGSRPGSLVSASRRLTGLYVGGAPGAPRAVPAPRTAADDAVTEREPALH
ncbi:hypothetical protein [Allonocardiopsis opalescens]|uniref:Uncharacterized protein n=1 Tax=Allonocardiopsis opalescens TaxID=1144618 RepID=A0A2T0QDF1_9ACTN|nr:hypothetical protein [Allonocardiopsis opalescens]PRY01873.1 hypothetical protein CLV72_101471 [Allonocardiopsis opalescens]